MDDNGAPAAVAPAEGKEPMSKSALKRKLKASSVDQSVLGEDGNADEGGVDRLGGGNCRGDGPMCLSTPTHVRAPISLPSCPT